MYYDNKTSFYIRQYGPRVLVLMFSIFLIASGVFIFMANTSTGNNPHNVASNEIEVIEQDNLQSDPKLTVSTKLSDELNLLNILDKTTKVLVKDIMQDGKISIVHKDFIYNVNLIGIDYSKSTDKINILNELKDKEVYIAFDKIKSDENGIYVYMYLEDGVLYNKSILQNGLAILKVERNNTSLLDELLQGQLTARANSNGIWSK